MLHHRRYRAASGGPEFSSTSVFITPMLDMSFQILAFFVVTFNPPALEGRLPWEAAAGEQGGPKPVQQSTDAKPTTRTQLPPPITVSVISDRHGVLESIALRVEGDQDPRPPIKGKDVERLVDELQDELTKLKPIYPSERRITIELPYRLHWDYSILIMDSCRSRRNRQGSETLLFPQIETELKDR